VKGVYGRKGSQKERRVKAPPAGFWGCWVVGFLWVLFCCLLDHPQPQTLKPHNTQHHQTPQPLPQLRQPQDTSAGQRGPRPTPHGGPHQRGGVVYLVCGGCVFFFTAGVSGSVDDAHACWGRGWDVGLCREGTGAGAPRSMEGGRGECQCVCFFLFCKCVFLVGVFGGVWG